MQRLLSIEWYKIRYYKTFWILLGLFVLGMFCLNYLVFGMNVKVKTQAGEQNADLILGHPYSYPDIWHTVSFMSGYLLFLPGLIIITLMTNEYTYRTHRQNIIDGWTRLQFIGVKLIWALILTVISTLVALAVVLWLGGLGTTPFGFTKVEFLGYFFLEALSYMTIALLLAILLKRAGLAIALFFLYIMILKNSIAWLIDHLTSSNAGNYLPMKSADALLPFPFIKDLAKAIMQPPPPASTLIVVSLVYLGLFIWAVIGIFQKADL
jgi:ABC-type transport system involved in multi-copper enzyme maturation permease subunit